MDTHPTAPCEAFNAAWQNAGSVTAKYGSATMAANNVNALRKKQISLARSMKAQQPAPEQADFRSVFKPKPEQVRPHPRVWVWVGVWLDVWVCSTLDCGETAMP